MSSTEHSNDDALGKGNNGDDNWDDDDDWDQGGSVFNRTNLWD